MFWDVLSCIGEYWVALGRTGLFLVILGCNGCTSLYWANGADLDEMGSMAYMVAGAQGSEGDEGADGADGTDWPDVAEIGYMALPMNTLFYF